MKMPKKIYFVMPNFSVIGAQRVALDFGLALLKEGVDVYWIAGGEGPFVKEIGSDRCISYFPLLHWIPKVRLIESLFRLILIARSIKDGTIVSITPFLNRYLCLLKRFGIVRARLVIEDHAYPPRSNIDEFPRAFNRWFYESTVWLYSSSDKLRVLSPECANYYRDKLGVDSNKVVVFENLLNLPRIVEAASLNNQFMEKNKKRIVYIGRFTTQKNIRFLIEAFNLIKGKVDAEFYIIGYGPEESSLKKLIDYLELSDRVYIIGSSAENFSILKTADVFPIASLWEGMGLTIAEAMLLNVPVVSTDFVAGPRFYFGEGSGRISLVEENDIEAFASAIEFVLLNPYLAAERATLARAFIERTMDVDSRIIDYQRLFLDDLVRGNV